MTTIVEDAVARPVRPSRGVRAPKATVLVGGAASQLWRDGERRTLFVDLYFGLVRPNAAAVQICQQLGLSTQPTSGANGLPINLLTTPQTADLIAGLIDRETLGFAPALVAQVYVEAVLRAIETDGEAFRVAIIPPQSEAELGEENLYFLQFLAQQAPEQIEIVVISDKPISFGPGWEMATRRISDAYHPAPASVGTAETLYTVPGVLLARELTALGVSDPAAIGLLPLGHECWLVPTEHRGQPSLPASDQKLSATWTTMAQLSDPWLKGYALARLGSRQHISTLVNLGWRAVAEGGNRVGLELFAAAKNLAPDPLTAAQLESMILGTKIGLEDYLGVAEVPLPSASLPPRLRGQLLQHKAWGLAMLGRLEEAQPLFLEACALTKNSAQPPSREYLYLINITAFTFFRRGQLEEAFRLEDQMREGIAQLPKPDLHLDYINSLNSGRLYLRKGDADRAEYFFERANATNNGLRTLADRLNVHVYRARIAEIRKNAAEVKKHWFRAAIAWVSHPLPESLSARTARLLLGHNPPPRHLWTAEVSAWFSEKLRALYSISAVDDDLDAPAFTESDQLTDSESAELVGSSLGSVIVSDHSLPVPQDHPAHRALRVLLRAIFARETRSSRVAVATAFYVDDQLGTELPATHNEVLSVAIRMSLGRALFEGEVIYDSAAQLGSEVRLAAALAPAVLGVQTQGDIGAVVAFRRYRGARSYSAVEAALIKALVAGESSAEFLARQLHVPADEISAALRRLENDRVVSLRVIPV